MNLVAARGKLRADEVLLRRASQRLTKAATHAESAARNQILWCSGGVVLSTAILCASVASYDTLTLVFDPNVSYYIDVFSFLCAAFLLSAIGSGFEERRNASRKVAGLRSEVERRTRDTQSLRAQLDHDEREAALHGPQPTEAETLSRFVMRNRINGSYPLSSQLSKAVAGFSAEGVTTPAEERWGDLQAAHEWSDSTLVRVQSAYAEYRESRESELTAWEVRRSGTKD
jgi:hypothetical protein